MSQHKKRAAENLSPSPLLSHPGESKKVKCGNDTDDDDSNYEADGTRRYEHRYPHLITRHWCSPQCLLGLSCDLPMDPDCPNYALHCTLADCHDHSEHNHPHTFDEVKAGMQAKLRHGDIWQIMEPIIGCRGNLGQLFRILFPDLGYAFLAVGLDSESAIRLKRENDIYKHIWMTAANTHENGFPLIGSLVVDDQGERKRLNVQVPISFGVLEPLEENLDVKYPLISVEGQIDDRVCNTWLLLSHHHSDPTNPIATRTLQTKLCLQHDTENAWLKIIDQCEEMLSDVAVRHKDLRVRNMLWCEHLESLVLIDFVGARVAYPHCLLFASLSSF